MFVAILAQTCCFHLLLICCSSIMQEALRQHLLHHGAPHHLGGQVPIAPRDAACTSVLANRLLLLVGWGHLSPNTMRWLAEGAICDGARDGTLTKLASLGAQGKYAGNARRDLMRSLYQDMRFPSPLVIEIPMLQKSKIVQWQPQLVVNPLEIFEHMWRSHRRTLQQILGSNPREFWTKVRHDDPKLLALGDIRDVAGWEEVTYPIVLHGDGARFTTKNGNSLLSVQMKSLLSAGNFDIEMVPFFCLPKAVRVFKNSRNAFDSLEELWRLVVHILNAAAKGLHPERDGNGIAWPTGSNTASLAGYPLCGGRVRLVVWAICGDLEFLGNELKMSHHSSNNPCWLCKASRSRRSEFPITAVGDGAAWKRSVLTAEQALVTLPGEHPIFSLRGMTSWHVSGDLMHTGCLGVVQYVAGATLYEWVFEKEVHENSGVALEMVWEMIQDRYSQMGITNRLTNLTKEMIKKPNEWTCLASKAAEGQALLFVLADISAGMRGSSRKAEHRHRVLSNLASFYKIIVDGDMFLNEEDAHRLVVHADRVLLHNNWLLQEALASNNLKWPFMFKHHLLWHIADLAKYLNPRFVWAYCYEDFLGDVVKSAKACLAGTTMSKIGNKVIENYMLVLEVTVRNRE